MSVPSTTPAAAAVAPTPAVVRSAVDRLVSYFGAVLVVVLLAAGGGLWYTSHFIGNQVHDQLAQQAITMPSESDFAKFSAADQAALKPFAGQPMTTGAQAAAFANHYIAVHMEAIGGGKTYEEISAQYLALSADEQATADGQKLAATRQTMFMGNTLRGLLLNAYAFGTMGVVAGYAAIVAFIAAIILAVFVFLGLRHAKKA